MNKFDPEQLPSGATLRLGKSCFRHQSPISAICWHPNREHVFSAGWDLRIIRWNIHTGRQEQLISCPDVALSVLQVSNNGAFLAGANYRHGLWVWNLESGEVVWRLGGKNLEISAIAISNSGKRIATLGPTGCTEYDLKSGVSTSHPDLPDGACIGYGQGETLNICASILGLVQVWSAGNLSRAHAIGAASQGVIAAQFSSTGESLLVQPAGENMLEVIDSGGRALQQILLSSPTAATLSSDGVIAATATTEGIQIWRDSQVIAEQDLPLVTQLSLSAPGKHVAVLDESYALSILEIPDLKSPIPNSPRFPAESICTSRHGDQVILATRGGGIYAWSKDSGQGRTLARMPEHPRAVLCSRPDEDWLVTQTSRTTVGAFRLTDPRQRETYGDLLGEPELLCFSGEGNHWAYVDNNLIHIQTRGVPGSKPIPSPGAHQVENLTLSPAGDRLAVAWLGGVIGTSKLEQADAQAFQILRASGPAAHALAFSPVAPQLAIADVTGLVEVRELDSGRTLWSQRIGSVSTLAWNADGTLLAAGEYYGDIVLFREGVRTQSWHSESGEVLALCYSPNGRFLYSGHKNTTVLEWFVG